ncbi:MAG: alpha/beta fold hydrolase [Bacteroidota bacterium]
MKFTKVSFQNTKGESLSGRIDFPLISQPKAYVLFAHCFTCSKNLKVVEHISSAFTETGMAVLRFDFTGLGQSEGAFAETNFSSNLDDLKDAYTFLEQNYEAPRMLVGHSLGGAAVLHVASQLAAVQAVATIGAPAEPAHVAHLLENGREQLEQHGEAKIDIGGRPFTLKKQFLEDLEVQRGDHVIRNLGKALLVLHSPQDAIVDIENAQDIYTQAMHPKSFVSLDRADHLLSDEGDAKYVGMIIANWSQRYIQVNNAMEMPEGEVKVRLGKTGFTTEVIAGRHSMVADEPPSVGGEDNGPTPYGFLLSALGTCTAMTLRMYADFKKMNVEEIEVDLTHDKIHKQDGENSESSSGKIDVLTRNIKLTGDLSEADRRRLIAIADRCPVHKTLEGRPEIVTVSLD